MEGGGREGENEVKGWNAKEETRERGKGQTKRRI